jgi:hypothetical protein
VRPPFEYRNAVRHAFLKNPVAQRPVRIVAVGVGSALLLPSDANALVKATSAGHSLLETLAAQLLLPCGRTYRIRAKRRSNPRLREKRRVPPTNG